MDLNACYEVAAPEVVDEDFGTEIVVLNLADGRYFSLRGAASKLWRDMRAGHAPASLAKGVAKVDDALADSVEAFFVFLVEAGLIRPGSVVAEAPAAGDAASVAEMVRDRMPPVVEAFDDMAELILSDPIHDVEEDIGWPVRREAS